VFCPNCKAEYREGFLRCSTCNAPLVLSLRAEAADSSAARPALLWTGQDPVTFSVILNALNEAQIPYRETQSRDYAASLSRPLLLGFYGLPSWEVRVHPDNVDAARAAIEEAMKPVNFLSDKDAIFTVASIESAERNEAGAAAGDGNRQIHAPVEVWSAQNATLAESLREALIENHIFCWALTVSSGAARLLVRREDVGHAQEIIREILNRTSAA